MIRQDNPFPWVCGLICPHPCERACVRGHLDEPLNIKYLKAFVAEYASRHGEYRPPEARAAQRPQGGHHRLRPRRLSCAHYLALKGYRVTVFEALPKPAACSCPAFPNTACPGRWCAGKWS